MRRRKDDDLMTLEIDKMSVRLWGAPFQGDLSFIVFSAWQQPAASSAAALQSNRARCACQEILPELRKTPRADP